jgi:eukaryotic-like serine/threonine-protein kinase
MEDLDAARRSLKRSIELRNGGDAYEWFVLAMVLARQGDVERARQLHGKAVHWMKKERYSDFELHALDAEATELLHSLPGPIRPAEPKTMTTREAGHTIPRP